MCWVISSSLGNIRLQWKHLMESLFTRGCKDTLSKQRSKRFIMKTWSRFMIFHCLYIVYTSSLPAILFTTCWQPSWMCHARCFIKHTHSCTGFWLVNASHTHSCTLLLIGSFSPMFRPPSWIFSRHLGFYHSNHHDWSTTGYIKVFYSILFIISLQHLQDGRQHASSPHRNQR